MIAFPTKALTMHCNDLRALGEFYGFTAGHAKLCHNTVTQFGVMAPKIGWKLRALQALEFRILDKSFIISSIGYLITP
jgi:hypothetical protein